MLLTKQPEYQQWKQMRYRCSNPNNVNYMDYGYKGIKVCERWNKFECFIADMGHKPTPLHTIDRIDNAGNYEPSNCRWATQKEQQNNKSSNIFVVIGNQRKTVTQWCESYGLNPILILNRSYRKKISAEESLLDAIK